MLRIVIFIFFICNSIVFCNRVAQAAPSAQSTLTGLPKTIAKDSSLQIDSINLADGSVIKSRRIKKASKFSLSATGAPTIVSVTYLSRSSKTVLKGQSRSLGSFVKNKKKLEAALRIRLKKPRAQKRMSARLKSFRLGQNLATVGIPIDGISVVGPGAAPWMSRAQVQLLQTSLTSETSCYYKSGGFVLVDLDPEVMAARQREFQLCASGRADPASCVTDAYQPPATLLKGELSVNGADATLTLRRISSTGATLFESSVTGSVADIASWEKLTQLMTASLAASLCNAGTLEVTKASCETPSCSTPCLSGTAFRQLPTISGNAFGAVGASVQVGFNSQFASIDCGSWSVEPCDANVCCKRASSEQPESTSFIATLDLYQGTCLCPSGLTVTYDVITQLRLGNPIEIEKAIECPT